MSWYDYIPGVRTISKAADGDWKGALTEQFTYGSPIGMGAKAIGEKMGVPDFGEMFGFNDKAEGYDSAANKARALGDKLRDFQMEGLARAQNYYLPAQQMNRAVFGTPDMLKK